MICRRNSTLALASLALNALFAAVPAQAQDTPTKVLILQFEKAAVPGQTQNAPKVRLLTSMGEIVLQLDPDKAPKTVENFLTYVKARHYDGTVFHRVIDGFMIQGGGYTADMQLKPTRSPIPLEASNGLKNLRYTVAMARTGEPNSATSQFFINVRDNASLDAPNPDGHGYAVFGKVLSGTEVVDKIRVVPTGNKGALQNVPITPVTIDSATLVK
ncbi:peptidylprolyl isomerase [Verminephrobacter aporrectodeae]|uniref:Peptidyl-prolyl cis-trans isomerase n=1 Tax=Verminephrobacter aporrectodeae subsp. tuberculatae TaxID=1110392 RepID=A0ABT3KQA8_9BURK|nr:peptidylprolyl isomerase [Verminephrobacter aporrectodeae]MCW5220527.1 peptidyl-prolyl cis-trans isomerase [Verminephrobacter aporrectodeae subsp. tuberculatae]MCW5289823.1 peptidyl-prolyl cis-trans isomerase [Verminephrobacter aporrectodeae subsp. tuberculatae]MCW5320499.1 peptidyl-prolyl cis-trans isomerase [Verminephrobacter aporrectodeae subsp. tuberculatae]MCW8163779.1 peptidyl-prolyl cis-trans isomerase [Verminephrobacter aporrectodeae subsp. tuberculatae]MCW8168014.1 peptidyl-prolyl 